MKNFFKAHFAPVVGIIVFVAVIGFAMAACDDGGSKDELDGTTWIRVSTETTIFKFNSPNFTVTVDGNQVGSGTYSVSGNTVTFTYDGDTVTGTLSGNTLIIYDPPYPTTTYTKL